MVLHVYLFEQFLNLVFGTLIKICNIETFYEFLGYLGMHHTKHNIQVCMWPVNKDDTNLYHPCLLATYKLVYYGHNILRICMFTTNKLVKYYEFVCFQLYENNTMNLYVTN